MRGPRIKEQAEGYYHMVSRVVDRRMLFDINEKERFRRVLRMVFSFGCERGAILLMNHFVVDGGAIFWCSMLDEKDLEAMRSAFGFHKPE